MSRPFGVTLANGDGFFIYPSEAGPLGSLRTEALRDAAEDIELLRWVKLSSSSVRAYASILKISPPHEYEYSLFLPIEYSSE